LKVGKISEECGISIIRVEANQETNMKYAASTASCALQYEFINILEEHSVFIFRVEE
jgi:hypothetical protein